MAKIHASFSEPFVLRDTIIASIGMRYANKKIGNKISMVFILN
jgi:hypothetical protein